jgi:hypothetical protein
MADIKKLLESFDRIGEDKAKIKAPAPRNVVAKNAKTSGAGQHKNPREIENTRKEKHKKDFLKDLHEAEKDTRILRRIEEAYSKFKEAKMHISPSGVKTNMDPSDDDYAINYGKNGLVAKHRKELGLDVETGEKKDVAEGLNEFAPDGFNGGDDGEEFNPGLAKMAYEAGIVKGASLADGATLEQAMAIDHWDSHDGGMYKQYFAKGFKQGRMNKIKHNNKQYNLNLKLMKDGSIRHGEQGVAEGSLVDKQVAYWDSVAKDKKNKEREALKAKKEKHEKTPTGKAEKYWSKKGVAEDSETHKYQVVVKGHKRSYSVWVEAKNEEVAIIRAQQYVAREHNDTAKRAAVVDMKKGVAEAEGQQLSVQQLAMISDEALDNAYGYGRSSPGNTFGWQANLMSAAYAKKMIDAGITDIEQISDAIHKGWNVTAQKFVQDPDQFDDTEKLRQAGKLDAKLQQRAKLMKINYSQLDNEEQEKDRVVARALLQAIRGDQGVTEELKMKKQQEFYGKNQRLPDTSTSLAKRSIGWPEVPNVPRTDDGTPTVQHRFHGKGVHTRLDPRPEQTSVQRKDASIEKPIPAFLQKGMAETSDVSGLLAASKLNNSYIITAELAEGGTKKFRVKAQSEQVALEKFKKHYAMAKVIDVTPEVQEATTMPTSPTAPTSATSTTTTSATQQKPLNLQAVQQQLKIPGNPMPGGTASADNVQSMAVQAVIQKALAGKPLDSAENNLYHSILQKANK